MKGFTHVMTRTAVISAVFVLAGTFAFPSSARGDDQTWPAEQDWSLRDDAESADNDAGSGADADASEGTGTRWLAIRGGVVHTVSGPVLRGTTILCRDGKIYDIGHHVQIPDDAQVIDADGLWIYPGLIAVRSSGIIGADPGEESTNVFGLTSVAALAGGLTTVVSGNAAYKVLHGEVENMLVRRDLFVTLNYSSRDAQGKRRLRQNFDRLRNHLRDVEAYERRRRTDPSATAPDARWIRGNLAQYMRLLKGEAVALMSANRVHELLQICELAERYGISVVVSGAAEGWLVAPQLSRAGVSAIVTPRVRIDRNEVTNRPNGSNIENAGILHQSGIPLAIVPSSTGISFGGLGGRDLLHLRMEAAFGVRGGLSNDAALRSITLDAARILGIDDRVGSIEVGKDADFVIADGDILHYATHARWTIVNGGVQYDKQSDTLFDHIRPDGDDDAPPPVDHWPRRLGSPW